MNFVVVSRSVDSMSPTADSLTPTVFSASFIYLTIAILELIASEPPFNITELPALNVSANASAVTFGLDS